VLTRARERRCQQVPGNLRPVRQFPAILAIAQAYDDIWCSAGVHPHHAKDFGNLTVEQLIEAASSSEVVAIGETGLDFHYGYSAEKDQVECLRKHIDAARNTGLPLILHTREADDLMADILEQEYQKGAFQPLLHCYTGGADLAQRALALGAYVSVSGILSFKSAKDVRAVIADVPMDRIILETDCPYLAPVPMRGRRNEPAYLPFVADALANLKGMSSDKVKQITEDNAIRLFSKVTAS
jgi:TatD DNase family protein